MQDGTAKQNSQKERETHSPHNEIDALQNCYKQIGIPAVAAAVLYQGDSKNPACGPVASRLRT
jgi:hypothetical protein